MRLIFWVTALAVLSSAYAKNSTAKTKPKRQLEGIRTPQNLQYSLVLPHSRVAHFRSLTSSRRISNVAPKGGKLPPYAVQMEPVVQYSQKDPLYDPNLDNLDDNLVNKNEIRAQSKILNIHDQADDSYGPPYGALPTAPLYGQEPHHPHYIEAPEPIIEIIIKESNESLPAPPPPTIPKKKKEPVHVFYVKYSKDPHSKDKVIYEKPIPAITPPTNDEDDHHADYVTVTPEPVYLPPQTTTLRAIIKPESEVYHSDSSVKVTFGNEGRHYSDRRESSTNTEDREETAPRPAIVFPNQQPNHPPLGRSVSSRPHYHDPTATPPVSHSGPQNYRPSSSQHAQSRIQFQQTYVPNEQQLPRQGPSVSPFRTQTHIPRQHSFGPSPSPHSASFQSGPSAIPHFSGPTVPAPHGPVFPTAVPRPSNIPSFQPRPNNSPTFAPRPHFNGPPLRTSFHSGPQRPFHQPPQTYFDEPKYLQENYHTITTEQVDSPKDQLVPTRQSQNYNFLTKPSPSPTPAQFQDLGRPQHIPLSQQLPQQRPHQQFADSTQNKPPNFAITPSRSPFFNLKPSPPQIETNRPPFQQPIVQPQHQQQFSFHQGPQSISRPLVHISAQENTHSLPSFPGSISSPSPIPPNQFLPQPSPPTLFNFQPQPSSTPEQQVRFRLQNSPSERPPQFQQPQSPSERPLINHQNNFQDQSNLQHQQNVGQFVPKGGELVAAIPKYEQHITVNGPTAQPDYSTLNQPSQSTLTINQQQHRQLQEQQHRQLEEQQQQLQQHQQLQKNQQQFQRHQQQQEFQQHQQQRQQQQEHQQRQQQLQHHQQQQRLQQQQHLEKQQHQEQQQQQQEQQQQEQQQQQQQNQYYDTEQEQVRQQLAQNVQKQQEEIQRLQTQLLLAQQQHQQQQHNQEQSNQYEQNFSQLRHNFPQQHIESTSPTPQYSQERSRPQPTYATSTVSPPYYQSTSRTVEIKPTTQKYLSSTVNSIDTTPETKKEEKKRKPTIELPDEVPDDLRQQLLSSGILDNADISVLDYDKVGETPLESLPPDQLANFFSAGGGQQIASSEHKPIVVRPNGDQIASRVDDDDEDQEIAASENVPSYVAPPESQKQAVEMKVVHFDPKTTEGQNIAKDYVKEDATQLEPVALNDKKYNRYLPLKVSGNQFPLPDILKGKKITSVVVLAPVETEAIDSDHVRSVRAAGDSLKGIKFVAGDSLQDVLKRPTKDNFEKWLETEKKTSTDLQSIILLVIGNDKTTEEREIFMYDITSGNVNKLDGELSSAFIEAAENNSLSKDIEKLAIEGEGTPENFKKDLEDKMIAEGSENVPLLVDLSGVSLVHENSNQVSISSGYSKTKLGRSLRRH